MLSSKVRHSNSHNTGIVLTNTKSTVVVLYAAKQNSKEASCALVRLSSKMRQQYVGEVREETRPHDEEDLRGCFVLIRVQTPHTGLIFKFKIEV